MRGDLFLSLSYWVEGKKYRSRLQLQQKTKSRTVREQNGKLFGFDFLSEVYMFVGFCPRSLQCWTVNMLVTDIPLWKVEMWIEFLCVPLTITTNQRAWCPYMV